jgi:acetoin utilization protein AcuB
MFVKDYMTRHPVMVDPDTSLVEAQALMAEAKVRHLPVIRAGKRLEGLVTRERLRIPPTELGSLNVWEITRFLTNLTVTDVMVKKTDVITIGPEAALETAAQIMVKNRIGCLPVLEEDIVVGIITETDMLVQLADLLGGGVHGLRVTIRMPDEVGTFAAITSAIAARGWGIYASGCVPAPKRPGFWDGVFKIKGVPQDDLVAVLEKIADQEIVDVREM